MIKSCLARIGCLTVILAVIGAGWFFREDLTRLWNRLEITSASEPSQAMAERAYAELSELLTGERSGVELTQPELQSLLTYRAGPLLPAGISDPVVEVRDSTLVLSARVDPRQMEDLASPEVVERLFSDSARVVVELWPGVVAPGVARVKVITLQAGSVVVPSLMVPWILEGVELEGVERSGVMLFLPTPRRVQTFVVENGRMVLDLAPDG